MDINQENYKPPSKSHNILIKLTSKLKTILKNDKNIKILNIGLIILLLLFGYIAISQPTNPHFIKASNNSSPEADLIALSNHDDASDMSDLKPDIISAEKPRANSTINSLFPFANKLPVATEKFTIDLPTDDGRLLISAEGQAGKTAALGWLAANGVNDPSSIDIEWSYR